MATGHDTHPLHITRTPRAYIYIRQTLGTNLFRSAADSSIVNRRAQRTRSVNNTGPYITTFSDSTFPLDI